MLGESPPLSPIGSETCVCPGGLQERVVKVDAAVTKLTGPLGRPPTIREVASHLAISEEEVLDAFAGSEARRIRSLDQPVGGGADADFTVGDRVGTEEAGFELAEHRATIDTVLPVLSEREREVIRLRFVDDMTQSQIAERIGHSQMHVSRILRGALARLHEEIAGEVRSSRMRSGYCLPNAVGTGVLGNANPGVSLPQEGIRPGAWLRGKRDPAASPDLLSAEHATPEDWMPTHYNALAAEAPTAIDTASEA